MSRHKFPCNQMMLLDCTYKIMSTWNSATVKIKFKKRGHYVLKFSWIGFINSEFINISLQTTFLGKFPVENPRWNQSWLPHGLAIYRSKDLFIFSITRPTQDNKTRSWNTQESHNSTFKDQQLQKSRSLKPMFHQGSWTRGRGSKGRRSGLCKSSLSFFRKCGSVRILKIYKYKI